jgi:copper chaperone CopZ
MNPMKMVKYFSVSLLALLVIISGVRTASALNAPDKTATLKMKVEVHCSDGKERLIEGMKKVDGVKSIKVDVPKKMVDITYDPAKINKDKLVYEVEQLGFRTEFSTKDAKIPNKCTNPEGKEGVESKCPGKK